MAKDEEKKIIVDEDWKQQAQKEKEQLEQEQKQEKEQQQGQQLPEATFEGLMSMLATQAFFALGLIRLKEEDEPRIDLGLAKYNIDMLGLLEEKTKGNLSENEQQMLDKTLEQLRMAFVQVSSGSGSSSDS